MKKIYCKAIVSITALAVLFGSALFLNNTYSAYFTMWGNTYNCTDPTADGYNATHNICYSWCFVEETKVTMADGSEKNIEDVVQGDWLKWSIWPNKVQYVIRKFNDGKVYSFNGGRYFVTDSHPFKTTEWWKSINPEATKLGHPGVEVEKLEIGDILITENGNVELKSLDGKDEPQEVYTFVVNGTHDYYADGYLVHNKYLGINGVCPVWWYAPWGVTYDWSYSLVTSDPDACVLRDLWAPVLIWPSGGGWPMADVDIMNMIYWDKDWNNTYDDGTDRPLIVPTYAVSTGGSNGYPFYLVSPYYYAAAGFWYNNGVNLAHQWYYTYWVSQSSSAWVWLMNQWFTTNDNITSGVNVVGGIWYITGLQIGLDFSCAGTGTETLEFTEYSCPAWYTPAGTMCYTWSTVMGGPCTTNADCTSGWTCNGYSAPNTPYKYNDGLPWNASHPNWWDRPHAPGVWEYCRDWAEGWDSDPGNPPPCWLYGTCGQAIWGWGCGWFIVNNNSTPWTCSTSSSNYIAATETTVTEVVACTGTWGSCTPNRTCPGGYTLTGDTNADGNPNCINWGVTASLDTVAFGPAGTCNGTSSATCAQILPCACDTWNGFECDTNNNSSAYWGWAPQQCQDLQGDIANNHTINYYKVEVGGNTEATDTNNCANCVTTTESPAVCDINDPLMAWVCYIPGGYGTTLLVSDGKVGINNASPEYALDVDGTIRAAQVLTLSDIRLKSSIAKIDSALEKIRTINWYTFTWKDSWEPDLWVLAQEVEKVFAEAVETDVNGKKTVQYNALLAPIIDAIHELNTQIDILYNEKFDNQVKRIEAIEKVVK